MNVYPTSFIKDIPNVTYVTATGSDPGLTGRVVTFSNISIGGPGFIVVGIMGAKRTNAAANYSATVTIGGVSATELVATGSLLCYSGLFGRTVSSGTTATIVVTFNQNIDDSGIGIWRVTGLNSETPIDTSTVTFALRATTFNMTVTPTGRNQVMIMQSTNDGLEGQSYNPNIRNYGQNRTYTGNQAGGSTILNQTTNYTVTVTTGSATTSEMGGVAVVLR